MKSSGCIIGVSVLGMGRAGLIHAVNLRDRVPGTRLVSVAEPLESLHQEIAAAVPGVQILSCPQSVLSDPAVNAVVIATPTVFHQDLAIAAARAGKHVFCEKPMAMNVVECERMITASKEAGVKLQIGFMRRFDASYGEAYEQLARGRVGRPVMVRSQTYGPSVPRPWMYDLNKSNGPLAEVNSHDIDSLRWFSGSEFVEVYAIAGNFRCPEARETFPDFYDNVSLVGRLANGMQGMITGAQGVGYGYDARCEILGEKGLITVGSLRAGSAAVFQSGESSSTTVKSWTDLFECAYLAEIRDFVSCIRENRPPRATGRDGLEAVRVVLAGNQSIREGRPVRIQRGD